MDKDSPNGNTISRRQCTTLEPIRIPNERRAGTSDFQMDSLYEKMKSERERLQTFTVVTWPLAFILPEELAKAGFFYLLNRDRVQCAFCKGIVCSWEPTDRPLQEHQRHYPRCRFLNGYNVGNIPIGRDPIRDDHLLDNGQDECGWRMSPTEPNNNGRVHNQPSAGFDQYGVQPHRGPKNPKFVSLDARIASFASSARAFAHLKSSCKQLAEAGFFSIGNEDYVKCYYCDGGLCNWEPNDDPWVEHAHNFPDCHFLFLNKGSDFVKACENRKPEVCAEVLKRYSLEEDPIAIMVVKKWMKSELVKHFQDIQSPATEIIKQALHKRWVDKQAPFEHFDELRSAVEALSRNNETRSTSSSDDDEHKSSSETASMLSSSPASDSPTSERLLCKICMDREIGVLFLPCGHVVACTQCAPGVSDCPVCRKSIKGSVRTFFS